MTTPTVHPYSLRARAGKTAVAKASVDAASTFDDEIPDVTSAIGTSPVTRRQFSDVVSGRKSPTSQGGQALVSNTSDEGSYLKYDDINLGIVSYKTPDQNLNHSVVADNRNAWNSIPPRHSRSPSPTTRAGLATADKMKIPKVDKRSNRHDAAPAVDPVAAAEDLLTAAQRNNIERRYRHVANKQLTPASPALPGEGPPKSKGKGVDSINWGNLGLSEEEQDLEAQQAALDLLKRDLLIRKAERVSKDARRVKKTVRGHASKGIRGSTSQTPAPQRDLVPSITRKVDNRPIRQIPQNSYIGQTLKNLHRLGTPKRRSGNDPSSSSSSDSSDSSSDPDGSENDDNADRDNSPAQRRRSRSKGKHRSKRSPRSGLKPIAPKEYNGAADARAYNRFVTEGTTYVLDGRVPKNRQVFVLSYYLDGIAYDFYTQKVSMNFAEWRLQEFFEELFNYCFPVNYRMEQRLKLSQCFQNEKKVSAYVHELEELYNMIGAVNKREKVIKLWDGLRSSIQQGLWQDLFNPETSTWEEVVDHASILEIAHSIQSEHMDEYGHSEYMDEDSNSEYTDEYCSSESEGQNQPDHLGDNPPGNFQGGFQSNRSGFQTLHRNSSDRAQPLNDKGRFSSSIPPGSKFDNEFGNRASGSRETSDLRFAPKPFDAIKLNIEKEEKAELMASGKCFACREVGHLARDCPIENIKRSSSSEPPVLSNFNIGLGALDGGNSDEVEHLYSLRVSTMTIFQDEISPEERNITPRTPDWGAENDIIPADRRSALLNHHILDQVPELTGVPWASPKN
jgi:hypothetical protein